MESPRDLYTTQKAVSISLLVIREWKRYGLMNESSPEIDKLDTVSLWNNGRKWLWVIANTLALIQTDVLNRKVSAIFFSLLKLNTSNSENSRRRQWSQLPLKLCFTSFYDKWAFVCVCVRERERERERETLWYQRFLKFQVSVVKAAIHFCLRGWSDLAGKLWKVHRLSQATSTEILV